MLSTDFWWLSPEETTQYRYVELFHQEPYSDEPKSRKDPYQCPMEPSDKRYLLGSISQWKDKFRNTNVFRSFALYSSEANGRKLIGPFVLDIDRTCENELGYVPDYHKALEDTRFLVQKYCSNLKDDEDFRIIFTGHKGFHIEIHPRVLDMPSNVDRRRHFENRRREINRLSGIAPVDRFHDHLRLHNSINHWIDHRGQRTCFMSFQVSLDELFSLGGQDIVAKAKNLASAELGGWL